MKFNGFLFLILFLSSHCNTYSSAMPVQHNSYDKELMEQIIKAIRGGNFNTFKQMIEENPHWLTMQAAVNVQPIHQVVSCGNCDMFTFSLEQDPSVLMAQHRGGGLPIHCAA